MNVMIWFIAFAGVNRKADGWIFPHHFPVNGKETRRISFLVIFPSGHVDTDPEVTIAVNKSVRVLDALFSGRRETKHHCLKAHRHSGSNRIRLTQSFPVQMYNIDLADQYFGSF
jgi:hypothetical protein